MHNINKCPLCGHTYFKRLYTKSFSHPGDYVKSHLLDAGYVRKWILFNHILKNRKSAKFSFMVCKNCGFIFLSPRLNEKDMGIKYKLIEKLGSVKARKAAYPVSNLDKRAKVIYHSIAANRKGKLSGLKVLDFGGAEGYNLQLFAKNNKCYVVDYEKWNLPKNINYLCRTADKIPRDMYFDIILCCHILEHAVNPIKVVKALAKHLAPGGTLYIEVPFQCFYSNFKQLRDPLTHINFFSNASLSYLLLKCGLSIKRANGALHWLYTVGDYWLSIIAENNGRAIQKYEKGDGYKSTLNQLKGPLPYICWVIGKILFLKQYLSKHSK